MADGDVRRHRFGAVVFGLVALAAVLAVFPATAPLGVVLCLLLVVPAIVAVWRTRRAPVGTRRRSVAALVVAPVFLVVGAAVMPHPPVTVVAEAAPAAVPAPVPASEPATALPVTAAPTTTTAPVQDPAVVAAAAAPAVAPGPAVPQAVAAPRPVVAQPAPRPVVAKPAAPKPAAPKPVAAAPAAGSSCGADGYINSSGNCVPRPVAAPSAPAGATAQCKDGTYSFSQHRSGTCSGHGGVSRWL